MKNELLKLWHIQEMLLQMYRLIFWIIQTVLLCTAGIIATGSGQTIAAYFILFILAVLVMSLGQKMIQSRAQDVSYFQLLILKTEKGETLSGVLTEFKKWQRTKASYKQKMLIDGGIRPSVSRKVFEFWMPVIYFVTWITLGLILFL